MIKFFENVYNWGEGRHGTGRAANVSEGGATSEASQVGVVYGTTPTQPNNQATDQPTKTARHVHAQLSSGQKELTISVPPQNRSQNKQRHKTANYILQTAITT